MDSTKEVKKAGKPGESRITRLSGGLFIALSDDVYNDDGITVKYDGKVGIKYGADKSAWIRVSYADIVEFVHFLQEHSSHVNYMVQKEKMKYDDLKI